MIGPDNQPQQNQRPGQYQTTSASHDLVLSKQPEHHGIAPGARPHRQQWHEKDHTYARKNQRRAASTASGGESVVSLTTI